MRGIQRSILKEAIRTFGESNQITVAIEEMSELTKELCKVKRMFAEGEKYLSKETLNALSEEMADVLIMLEQLKFIFSNMVEVECFADKKINRLLSRIQQRKLKGGGEK